MKKLTFIVLVSLILFLFPQHALAFNVYTFTATNVRYDPTSKIVSFGLLDISGGNIPWSNVFVNVYNPAGRYVGTTQNMVNASTICNNYYCKITLNGLNTDPETDPNANVHITIGDFNANWLSQDFLLGSIEPPPYGTYIAPVLSQITAPTSPVLVNDLVTASASFTGVDATRIHSATWDWGDGSAPIICPSNSTSCTLDEANGSGLVTSSHTYTSKGIYGSYNTLGFYYITLTVTDNEGKTDTSVYRISVYNPPPVLGQITAPTNPIAANTIMTASANFTDQVTIDTHTAIWVWGDGNASIGTVTESNGSGSVSDNHIYTTAGVYSVLLIVKDNEGGESYAKFNYVSVYDSNTSFAGGRSFDNPQNAFPNISGKVTFGISSKYTNINTLTGNVKMNFKAANLDFVSTSLQSLATSNGTAYLRGSGILNGGGGYTFIATGHDGSVSGGNDLIRFQIKDALNNVIYDSQFGASDTSNPTTPSTAGNIRVH